MSSTLNKVFLMGNLTRDPELRYVPSGIAVVNMGIALNRVYTNQSGEKKEEVSYVKVVAWARLAEICAEYLSKGKSVFVEGRLQSRSWENEQGQKRTVLEVVADNVQFIGRREPSPREDSSAPKQDKVEEQVANQSESVGSFPAEEEVPF